MINTPDLETLKRASYRDTYSDGILDIFVGVSFLWIGSAWIWLSDLAGVAGVLPAVFLTTMLAGRKRFVESRTGYVKWSEPRRRWERRNLWMVFAAGVGLLLAGVGVFAAASSDTDLMDTVAPGLLAFLLALLAVGLAFVMETWRMLGYAAVLAIAGVITASAEANPGWPLLGTGPCIAVVGVALLIRYARRYPAAQAG